MEFEPIATQGLKRLACKGVSEKGGENEDVESDIEEAPAGKVCEWRTQGKGSGY